MAELSYRQNGEVPVNRLRALYEDVGWTTVTVRSDAVLAASIAGSQVIRSCWDGDLLVGFFRAITDGARCAHVLDLAVRTDYQKRGIGSKLFHLGMAALDRCDYVSLMAEHDVLGFYEKFGFFHHSDAMLLRRKVADEPEA